MNFTAVFIEYTETTSMHSLGASIEIFHGYFASGNRNRSVLSGCDVLMRYEVDRYRIFVDMIRVQARIVKQVKSIDHVNK